MTIAPWDNPAVNDEDAALVGQISAEWINDHGGINGRSINVILCNDFLTQSGAETCAREAVTDHVVALVGGVSIFDGSVLPIISAAHIPWVGEVPYQSLAYTSPDNFPVVGGGSLVRAPLAAAAAENCQRTVLIDAGQGSVPDVPYLLAGMKAEGKSFVAHISLSSSTADYSVYAAQAAQANPDCLLLDINPTEILQLIPALQQARVSVANVYSAADNVLNPNVQARFGELTNGWHVSSYFGSSFTAPWADYQQAITKYDLIKQFPSASPDGNNDLNTWVAFQAFKQVVSGMKGAITGQTLTDALNQTTDLTLGGLLPSVNLTKPNTDAAFSRIVNPYTTVMVVEDGKPVNSPPINAQALFNKGK
ncbi:MAG TPA: ABC transporter substrate-binding protein [Trebonia sp.]|jgi:ABC-type branched-subunit amino acid transport system substrate-binding protein|nr:ABC transporter substrate-binding protein [Trebonia sp.]